MTMTSKVTSHLLNIRHKKNITLPIHARAGELGLKDLRSTWAIVSLTSKDTIKI